MGEASEAVLEDWIISPGFSSVSFAVGTSSEDDSKAKEDDDYQTQDLENGRNVFKPGKPFVWEEHQNTNEDHKHGDYEVLDLESSLDMITYREHLQVLIQQPSSSLSS